MYVKQTLLLVMYNSSVVLMVIPRYYLQLFATMEIFVWLMEVLLLKAVLRSVTVKLGAQSVMISGGM